jgi:hypothetical protein
MTKAPPTKAQLRAGRVGLSWTQLRFLWRIESDRDEQDMIAGEALQALIRAKAAQRGSPPPRRFLWFHGSFHGSIEADIVAMSEVASSHGPIEADIVATPGVASSSSRTVAAAASSSSLAVAVVAPVAYPIAPPPHRRWWRE